MRPNTAVATRTLLAAGFTIVNSERHKTHIEIDCTKPETLNAVVGYRIAIFDIEELPAGEVERLKAAASRDGRVLVTVAPGNADSSVAWDEFLTALGGAVPNWRALAPDFGQTLEQLSRNQTVPGGSAEAWLDFEEAVADAIEVLLGVRVTRLGGRKRGKRVSDLLGQLPDRRVLVIDTKAYREPFDCSSGNLRPLSEYVIRQVARQRGLNDVAGALLVAAEFKQDQAGLTRIAGDFLGETKAPITFLRTSTLMKLVDAAANHSILRSAIRWPILLCRGGLVMDAIVDSEISDAKAERK